MRGPLSGMTNHSLDRLSGGFFFLLGLLVVVGAVGMPRFLERGASLYEAPGLTPGLLGIALAFSGLLLILRKSRADGASTSAWLGLFGDKATFRRIATALGLTGAYALILFGRVPFLYATCAFVFLFVLLFDWFAGGAGGIGLKKTLIAAAIGLTTGFGAQYLFQTVFLVQLP